MAKSQILSSQEQSIVRNLNELGYSDLTGLIPAEKMQAFSRYCLEKMKRADQIKSAEVTKNKDFWIRLSDEDLTGKKLSTDNPMVDMALQPTFLKIAASYMKQAPYLSYTLLTLSRNVPGPLKASQLWHQDRDNTNMLKIFVYLTDVNETATGPFTFFDKVISKKIKNSFIMRHLPDAEVFDNKQLPTPTQMIRPKLSIFLVDTSKCYHMGSRVEPTHERLMFSALYIGLPSNYPWTGPEVFTQTTELTPLQQMAIRVNPTIEKEAQQPIRKAS